MAKAKSGSPGRGQAQQSLSLEPKLQKAFQKKIQGMKKQPKLTSGVIYLGHIPKGFFEPQIRKYFSQFGTVLRLRLSRSKKDSDLMKSLKLVQMYSTLEHSLFQSGQSKGYAFVEFECDEVARIVAETMNNYLVGERLLKCQFLPAEKVHPQLFKGCDTIFKKPLKPAVIRYNKKRTPNQQKIMSQKLLEKERRLRRRLVEKGIDYDFPGFAAVMYRKKKQVSEQVNNSINSQDETPVCTPYILKQRQSLKDFSEIDDEISFKVAHSENSSEMNSIVS